MKVELFPLGVDEVVEPMAVPPVQGVGGALSWHRVQLTVPVGGPPVALPATVAVSPHVPPMAELAGGRIAVVLEQSWKLTVPVTVPFDPVKLAVSVSELPMVILGELILVVMAGNRATAPAAKLIACAPSPTPSKETIPT